MSDRSDNVDNALIWGERELDRGAEGKFSEFANASGGYVRRFAWWIVALALLIVIVPRTFRFIPAGHGGVLWKRFVGGTVHQPALSEGFHVLYPWNNLVEYDLRVSDYRKEYTALANDGLPVQATVSLRYRINPEQVSYLYQQFGEQYDDVLIAPQIGSIVREVVSRYPADQLYAYARARLETEIGEIMTDKLDFAQVIGANGASAKTKSLDSRRGYVFVEGLAVLNLELPKTVTTAIERKMAEDQMAQEYEFKVKREQMETQRRAIEVDGIKNYAAVAQAPWFRDYLKYIEIEANYDMAKSNNAKLVFLGNSASPPPNLNMTVPHP
jgi:regulator of protease activity HflC (stomatin/prohibitin superfamily)